MIQRHEPRGAVAGHRGHPAQRVPTRRLDAHHLRAEQDEQPTRQRSLHPTAGLDHPQARKRQVTPGAGLVGRARGHGGAVGVGAQPPRRGRTGRSHDVGVRAPLRHTAHRAQTHPGLRGDAHKLRVSPPDERLVQLRAQATGGAGVTQNERPPAAADRLGVGAEPRPERLPGRGVEGLQLQQHTIRGPEWWAKGSTRLVRLARLWILGGGGGREILAHRQGGRYREGHRRVHHGQPAQPPHHHGQRALQRQARRRGADIRHAYRLHSTSRAAVYRHQPEHRLCAHFVIRAVVLDSPPLHRAGGAAVRAHHLQADARWSVQQRLDTVAAPGRSTTRRAQQPPARGAQAPVQASSGWSHRHPVGHTGTTFMICGAR